MDMGTVIDIFTETISQIQKLSVGKAVDFGVIIAFNLNSPCANPPRNRFFCVLG